MNSKPHPFRYAAWYTRIWVRLPKCWVYSHISESFCGLVHYIWLFGRKWEIWRCKEKWN